MLVVFLLSLASVLSSAKVDLQGEVVAAGRLQTPVSLRLFNGKILVQTTAPDARGRFKFSKIDPGSYVIHVECDGYYAQDVPVQVVNSTSQVSITLQPTPDNPLTTAAINPFHDLEIPRQAKKEFDLGMREQRDGKCDVRLAHLKKALALYPRYGEAFTEMARCYLQMNDMAAAEAAFKSAIPLSTGIYTTVNLATLYISQGRLDEAQALITPVLQKNRTEGELYATQARIHFARGRMRDAEVAGLEAHARGHHSADIHLILAKIYEDRGNGAAVTTQLLNYLDENPRGATADQIRKQLQDIR